MMPVDGDSSARRTARAGSRARASSAAEPDQIRHAVCLGLRLDCGKLVDFRLARGDQELAALPVRNMIFPAKFIEHCFAADAPASLIEAGRIVDARVDHFAGT